MDGEAINRAERTEMERSRLLLPSSGADWELGKTIHDNVHHFRSFIFNVFSQHLLIFFFIVSCHCDWYTR